MGEFACRGQQMAALDDLQHVKVEKLQTSCTFKGLHMPKGVIGKAAMDTAVNHIRMTLQSDRLVAGFAAHCQ